MEIENCTICDQPLDSGTDTVVQVRKKGLESFVINSKLREDNKWNRWENKETLSFHENCRKRYSSSSSNPF